MRRIRLIAEYDGTNYVGWQIQPNGASIQEVIEKNLPALTHENIRVHGCGRTDSGVHALAYVLHFDTNCRIPADKFPYALNVSLPPDIRIKYGDEPQNPNFHSRFDVKRKHYRYTILCDKHASAFNRNTALHVHQNLDFDKMQRAAKLILGEHDFAAFKAEGTTLKSTVRTIYTSQWSRNGNYLYFDICGNGFMYNMVRILVGTMLEIGKGYKDEVIMQTALTTCDRKTAGSTAPAHGLTMTRVEYDCFDTADYTDFPKEI